MSDVVIYHPGTAGQAVVPAESLPVYRRSGWLLLDEHNANEADRAEREAADSKASKKGDA